MFIIIIMLATVTLRPMSGENRKTFTPQQNEKVREKMLALLKAQYNDNRTELARGARLHSAEYFQFPERTVRGRRPAVYGTREAARHNPGAANFERGHPETVRRIAYLPESSWLGRRCNDC